MMQHNPAPSSGKVWFSIVIVEVLLFSSIWKFFFNQFEVFSGSANVVTAMSNLNASQECASIGHKF